MSQRRFLATAGTGKAHRVEAFRLPSARHARCARACGRGAVRDTSRPVGIGKAIGRIGRSAPGRKIAARGKRTLTRDRRAGAPPTRSGASGATPAAGVAAMRRGIFLVPRQGLETKARATIYSLCAGLSPQAFPPRRVYPAKRLTRGWGAAYIATPRATAVAGDSDLRSSINLQIEDHIASARWSSVGAARLRVKRRYDGLSVGFFDKCIGRKRNVGGGVLAGFQRPSGRGSHIETSAALRFASSLLLDGISVPSGDVVLGTRQMRSDHKCRDILSLNLRV